MGAGAASLTIRLAASGGMLCAAAALAQPSLDAALAAAGDPARGRALLIARDPANCVLCHSVSVPELPVAGNLGPPLDGVGARLTPGQIRLRIVDSTRFNPRSIMPRYLKTDGLIGVASEFRGKTILDAQQVEDLVAFLSTLR